MIFTIYEMKAIENITTRLSLIYIKQSMIEKRVLTKKIVDHGGKTKTYGY